MSERIDALLERARQEIAAARTLADAGFPDQATSRSYYAVFYAAEAALFSLGETRSKHSAVIAAFGRHVVKEGGFDAEVARLLRRLFERRNAADYEWPGQPIDATDDPVAMAERFVDAVERWLRR
jgi:uncharacterized protein (UPF0332 family)